MSKITQYISSIGTDKYMHFLVCEVLAWLIARVLRLCGVDQWAAMAVGFGVAVAVGVSKELYDRYVQHEVFDWQDIVADVIGAVVGAIMSL